MKTEIKLFCSPQIKQLFGLFWQMCLLADMSQRVQLGFSAPHSVTNCKMISTSELEPHKLNNTVTWTYCIVPYYKIQKLYRHGVDRAELGSYQIAISETISLWKQFPVGSKNISFFSLSCYHGEISMTPIMTLKAVSCYSPYVFCRSCFRPLLCTHKHTYIYFCWCWFITE